MRKHLWQKAHAEVDALEKAGSKAQGGHLYLISHHIARDNCQQAMAAKGVTHEIVAGRFDEQTINALLENLMAEYAGGALSQFDFIC
jgi:pyrimidine deaminase RibD-like protein